MFSMCGCPPLSISPSLQSQETVGVISSVTFHHSKFLKNVADSSPSIQLHYYNLKEEILMSMIRRVAGRKYF